MDNQSNYNNGNNGYGGGGYGSGGPGNNGSNGNNNNNGNNGDNNNKNNKNGQMIMVFGASIGPVPLGWALDNWGAYDQMLYLMALAPVCVSALAILFLPQPRLPPAGE